MKIQIYLTLILAMASFGVLAQNQQPLPDTTEAPGTVARELPKITRITAVYQDPDQARQAGEENKPVVVYPNNILRFTITKPLAFLNSRPSDDAKVVLYVNGIEMKGIRSEWFSKTTRLQINAGQLPQLGATADIYIKLKRTDTTRQAWQFFYSMTNMFYDNYATLNASVGWEGMSQLDKATGVSNVSVVYYRQVIFFVWLVVFLVVIGIFLWVAVRTDALKDGADGAYSLSLTQLLFWTTIVIGAFIYTLVLTDIVTSFNTSILLLLGISVGTTGLAYAIDSNFASKNPNAPKKVHVGFIKDILTDGTGYSVQRIQTFAWNLVLGTYFVIYTIENKSMPEFSTTLLFLAGISSASYLGAKGPENTNSTTPVGAAGQAQGGNQNTGQGGQGGQP